MVSAPNTNKTHECISCSKAIILMMILKALSLLVHKWGLFRFLLITLTEYISCVHQYKHPIRRIDSFFVSIFVSFWSKLLN